MKPYKRTVRIADLIQRELALLLKYKTEDPRFSLVTITRVEVSADLSFARVFVTTFEGQDSSGVVKALNHAAGYFRTLLAKTMNLRVTPRLHFHYDTDLQNTLKVNELLQEDNVIHKALAQEND